MNAILFVSYYLKCKAVVTVIDSNGDISYRGKVADLPRQLLDNKQIGKIDGLGEDNDVIITLSDI